MSRAIIVNVDEIPTVANEKGLEVVVSVELSSALTANERYGASPTEPIA